MAHVELLVVLRQLRALSPHHPCCLSVDSISFPDRFTTPPTQIGRGRGGYRGGRSRRKKKSKAIDLTPEPKAKGPTVPPSLRHRTHPLAVNLCHETFENLLVVLERVRVFTFIKRVKDTINETRYQSHL